MVVNTHCPYLGIELTNIYSRGRVWTNPSIDRIDPELGYIPGNVEVISVLANVMKNSATKEQLITFANSILKKYT